MYMAYNHLTDLEILRFTRRRLANGVNQRQDE